MTIDMPPVPPAIIEFAENAGYKWGVEYDGKWKEYDIYYPFSRPRINRECNGLPQYILMDNNKSIRWNTIEEQEEIMGRASKEN